MGGLETMLDRRTFMAAMVGGIAALAGRKAMAQQSEVTAGVRGPAWLLFTKSAGYEHSAVTRAGDASSHLARCLRPLFDARHLELTESKDGRLFEPATISRYAGFVFFTSGDLTTAGTDAQPPMTAAGKAALLDAVAAGTPFIGLHCASDTFHSPDAGPADPFIAMLGGEFENHGEQQVARLEIADPSFPGAGSEADWTLHEEWYVLKHLAADIKPIHLLQTAGLKESMYRREPFPITWTRTHGKGRVFYTGLAHREETVAGGAFGKLIGGALDWCTAP